jgi:hypothetical protein
MAIDDRWPLNPFYDRTFASRDLSLAPILILMLSLMTRWCFGPFPRVLLLLGMVSFRFRSCTTLNFLEAYQLWTNLLLFLRYRSTLPNPSPRSRKSFSPMDQTASAVASLPSSSRSQDPYARMLSSPLERSNSLTSTDRSRC